LSGKYEIFKAWTELPSLLTILSHAIALGEGRQNGETLKMQNMIRRLFADRNWLEKMFGWLSESERVHFFERFQASIAWDPSTHHTIVVRMTKIAPELESHLVKAEKKREYARITSPRSYAERQREYYKLINEDMPANVKRIEFAKSYGDLSENSEYQYAKDEQRVLMQKQALMQAELDAVKSGDFSSATTDEVMPGVEVAITAKDGERVYIILGEWDNDLERGIISSQTKVAQNLMGKKPGDVFELPDAEGNVDFATVKEIRALSDEVKEWMKAPAGV
jgi:transcription elongation GreA/GreB family factor